MEKLTVIEFCPQWVDETREAVTEARQIIKFLYSGERRIFWREKK